MRTYKLLRKRLTEFERDYYKAYHNITFHDEASHLISIQANINDKVYSTDVIGIAPFQLKDIVKLKKEMINNCAKKYERQINTPQ